MDVARDVISAQPDQHAANVGLVALVLKIAESGSLEQLIHMGSHEALVPGHGAGAGAARSLPAGWEKLPKYNCASSDLETKDLIGSAAQGRLGGPRASAGKSDVTADFTAGVPPTAEPRPAPKNLGTQYPTNDHVLVAESMVGTDVFGPYGCEDFVDAAFGLTTDTGIGHDMALSFYQSLAALGLDHHETPIPRGALVFSAGPYGNHVDISRGDGTFVSGGVQGLSPGYGDGHQVQILPTANLGAWTMYGWAYPPW
jgi:hypothetical protein